MDRASVVFDSRATYDDGSCYAYVLGCTDSLAQVSPIFNATPNPHLNLNPNLNPNPYPNPDPNQNFRPSATLRAECAYDGGCVRGASGEDITPLGFCHDESPPPSPALPPPPPAGGRRLGHASTPSASALDAYCVDTPGWSSSSDNTCAEYVSLRWCAAWLGLGLRHG